MTVFYVPIEPLEERYTQQWYDLIPGYFDDCVVIDGTPLQDEVVVGTFLDINSTVHYKMVQLQKISALFNSGQVSEGDSFFFGDIEFWGLESVRLMSQMNGINVRITGFLHAASYTVEDAFSIAESYQRYTELGWVLACDQVFVGSMYHKNAFIERRVKPIGDQALEQTISEIIHVSGNPLFKDQFDVGVEVKAKKNQIVLPNRFDTEKRPMQSVYLALDYKNNIDPSCEIVICTSRSSFRGNNPSLISQAEALAAKGLVTIKAGLSKKEYYQVLAESKVMISHSIEENFGYCIAESMYYDCLPLLANRCSHPELVMGHDIFLMDGSVTDLEKLKHLMESNLTVKTLLHHRFSTMMLMARRAVGAR